MSKLPGRGYPSDVSDEEWALCAPSLALMREDAPPRAHRLRAVFDAALRYLVKAGCGWRMLPHDRPPWPAVHQQAQRWIKAGCFEALAHDRRVSAAQMQDRAQVGTLWADLQAATDEHVELADVDQGYTGAVPAAQAAAHGIQLAVVKLDQAQRGFVERSFGWAARFRRLARDYERLVTSLTGLHWLAFVCLMLKNLFSWSS